MADNKTDLGVWASPEDGLAAEVDQKYTKWRVDKKQNEIAWFINASFIRGLQFVQWNHATSQLVTREAPQHRVRLAINRILPKVKARQAKFLKNRPIPCVIPASGDRDDKLDAEASQKAIEFVLRRQEWESKYRQILNLSTACSKAFAWLHWDQGAKATTSTVDEFGSQQWIETPEAGDVFIEVGTPFEVLVADPGIPNIYEQPEIMRVKLRELADVKKRYPEEAADIKGEVTSDEMFQYQRQIATLDARGQSGQMVSGSLSDRSDATKPYVVVKELFSKPCANYPKGRYVVVCAGKVLRKDDELPFGFAETNDPYPVVEFADMESVGQFWPTTFVEQMVPLQKEYNLIRSKLGEAIRLMSMPKIMSPVQAAIPKNAWNSEPGEHIRYQWYPGLPTPQVIPPPQVSTDLWNCVRLIKDEFDEVINIWPQSQGATGGSTSGFQTNLLQEATDTVHQPDIRGHEIAFEKLCKKIRFMMKQYYDVPRLLAVTGRNFIPEVVEFNKDRIDENAEIIVMSKAALSQSPAVRTQQVIELWNAGIIGDRNDPKTQARALTLIDAEGIGELQEEKRRDQDLARYEIDQMNKGITDKEPQPYEDHDVHYTVHTDFMKSFEYLSLPDEIKNLHKIHLVLHARFIDPYKAVQLSLDIGLPEMAQQLQMMIAPPQQQPGSPQMGMPPGVGQPPPGADMQGPPAPPSEMDQPMIPSPDGM